MGWLKRKGNFAVVKYPLLARKIKLCRQLAKKVDGCEIFTGIKCLFLVIIFLETNKEEIL